MTGGVFRKAAGGIGPGRRLGRRPGSVLARAMSCALPSALVCGLVCALVFAAGGLAGLGPAWPASARAAGPSAGPSTRPADPITAQDIERQIRRIQQDRPIAIHWKLTDDLIPAAIRGRMKVSQASPLQADMILRLVRRMIELWPAEVTRHVRAVYIFHELEMQGVKGVCMECDGSLYMTSNLPEYVLWPRILHEASHAVSRCVPLDAAAWDKSLAPGVRYIGAEATKGDPFEMGPKIHQAGFIVKYAQIDRDEEFAVLSQYLFTSVDEVRELMKKYPPVRRRASLAIRYYKALSPKIDLSRYDDVLWNDATGQAPEGPAPQPPAPASRPGTKN